MAQGQAHIADRVREAMRAHQIKSASVGFVIPANPFLDRFVFVRGNKEDGRPGPEKSFKCVGGGLDPETIAGFVSKNPQMRQAIQALDLNNRDNLLKLGGAAEVWEEIGWLVTPEMFPNIFLVREKHVPDLDDPRRVHLKMIFGLDAYHESISRLHDEIFECVILSMDDVEGNGMEGGVCERDDRGNVVRVVTRISRHHRDGTMLAHRILYSSDGDRSNPDPICKMPEGSCPFCGAEAAEEIISFDSPPVVIASEGPVVIATGDPLVVADPALPSDPEEMARVIRSRLAAIKKKHRRLA